MGWRDTKDLKNQIKLVERARDAGWFIYHTESRKWYSPEEFEDEFTNKCIPIPDSEIQKYTIRNQRTGLIEALQVIKKWTDWANEFSQRIIRSEKINR